MLSVTVAEDPSTLGRLAKWRAPLSAEGAGLGAAVPAPSAEAVEAWLVSRVAMTLGTSPDRIGVQEPLPQYGIDSAAAVGLTGELEDWLSRRLSPTLVYNYPTIRALASHLAGISDGSVAPSDEDSKEEMAALEQIQQLSEPELERLLQERLQALAERDAA